MNIYDLANPFENSTLAPYMVDRSFGRYISFRFPFDVWQALGKLPDGTPASERTVLEITGAKSVTTDVEHGYSPSWNVISIVTSNPYLIVKFEF